MAGPGQPPHPRRAACSATFRHSTSLHPSTYALTNTLIAGSQHALGFQSEIPSVLSAVLRLSPASFVGLVPYYPDSVVSVTVLASVVRLFNLSLQTCVFVSLHFVSSLCDRSSHRNPVCSVFGPGSSDAGYPYPWPSPVHTPPSFANMMPSPDRMSVGAMSDYGVPYMPSS